MDAGMTAPDVLRTSAMCWMCGVLPECALAGTHLCCVTKLAAAQVLEGRILVFAFGLLKGREC